LFQPFCGLKKNTFFGKGMLPNHCVWLH
jgi:hypothetical protein